MQKEATLNTEPIIELLDDAADFESALRLLSELNQVSLDDTRERFRLARTEGQTLAGIFAFSPSRTLAAVATFRFCWRLYCGRTLYIDDFITASDFRFKGYGSKLFRWLAEHARGHNCISVTLDTGVRVFGAHKFYHQHGMKITSHHMTLYLNEPTHHPYPTG